MTQLLQLLLASCMLGAAFAQENPFDEAPAASEPFDCEAGLANWRDGWSEKKKAYCCDKTGVGCADAPAPPKPPPTISEQEQAAPRSMQAEGVAAPGRRLGAINDLDIRVVDTNETGIYDGEDIYGFDFSLTIPSAGTRELVAKMPDGMFKAFSSPINLGGLTNNRRLEAEGDVYGRMLAATCQVTAAQVLACSATSVGGPGTCLKLSLDDGSGGACNAGSTVSAAIRDSNLAAVTNAVNAGSLNMDVTTLDSSGNALDSQSFTYAVLTQAGIAISDPITIYNGKKTKFWLPIFGKHLLVQTPDLVVSASVFQGPRKDLQWFDRFFIKLPDGRQVVVVGIKRDSGNNSARSRQSVFSQLDIKLGGSQEPLRERKNILYSSPDGQVKIAIGSKRQDPPRLHGEPITEFVNVETKSISFVLVASHAGNEFPDDFEMQKKHAHMDWVTREMIGTKSFTGILPQIWGVQPLSEEVADMLKSPADSPSICAEV
eukprot:TRINITY_DN606_c0_g2_i2.p1 TRINITY_DN606_c0_g2~~TRINITY_DN606_c0_g2_i2.p1  ORF type:complete len:506 (-),score=98.73 TRINITY_DN606_c0_g2_i2:119-1582(-)